MRKPLIRYNTSFLLLLVVLVISGCAGKDKVQENTLAAFTLEPALYQKPAQKSPAPRLTVEQMIERYQAILRVHDDPQIIARSQRRIADLKMLQAEKRQFDDQEAPVDDGDNYRQIAEHYRKLLQTYPDQPQNEQILYQLAKTYDYLAETDKQLATLTQLLRQFPQSEYRIESHYRIADIYYGRKQYAKAQQAYQVVVDNGDSSHFLNALYMRSWCLFKRSLYRPAAESFTRVLDKALTADNSVIDQREAMVDDVLHIISVIFSYMDNGQAIAGLYQELGRRDYEPLLYQELASLLLERDMALNAVDTYQVFIEQYPMHASAVRFQLAIIDTYRQHGYYQRIRPARDTLLTQYGYDSPYWLQADEQTRDYIRRYLQQHLEDMTAFYHARGQKLLKNGKQEAAFAEFARSVRYYRQWLAMYPSHPAGAEKTFLMAEALFEQQLYQQAAENYRRAAWQYPVHAHSEEAAYALVLTYRKMLALAEKDAEDETSAQNIRQLLEKQINAQQRYVQSFPQSSKALQIQINTAYMLFEQDQYQAAIESADTALNLTEDISAEQTADLVLLKANTYFMLNNYAAAEREYQQAQNHYPHDSDRYQQVTERLAACIYRQGEKAVADDNISLAISHFQRVGQQAPQASTAVNADYDAATYLLIAERWDEAVTALRQFEESYPGHAFKEDIPGKLVTAFENMQDWQSAADVLQQIEQNTDDEEKQRQALYLAAGYYQKAGNLENAVDSLRRYAHNYPEPFPLALEAQFRLAEIYRETGVTEKRLFWLDKIIAMEKRQSTERSRYLAALASKALAERRFAEYQAIALNIPLSQSLKEKRKAFRQTLELYQQINGYNVAEFSTYATHHFGLIYQDFARALLASEKPGDLSALELEQYKLLLEEQAYPFEEQAISAFEANAQHSRQGVYDQWVQKSFNALKSLVPARYSKQETTGFSDALY